MRLGSFMSEARLNQDTNEQIAELKQKKEILQNAVILGKACSKRTLVLSEHLAKLCSDGLTTLFGKEYSFIYEPVYEKDVLKGVVPKMRSPGGEYDSISVFGDAAYQTISIIINTAVLLFVGTAPKFIFFDEPFSNINSSLSKRIWEYVKTMAEKTGVQIGIISHMQIDSNVKYLVTKNAQGISSIERIVNE